MRARSGVPRSRPHASARVLAPRHVAEHAAAPQHLHRVRVVRVAGLARELERVADPQLAPHLGGGVVAKPGERRVLDQQANALFRMRIPPMPGRERRLFAKGVADPLHVGGGAIDQEHVEAAQRLAAGARDRGARRRAAAGAWPRSRSRRRRRTRGRCACAPRRTPACRAPRRSGRSRRGGSASCARSGPGPRRAADLHRDPPLARPRRSWQA